MQMYSVAAAATTLSRSKTWVRRECRKLKVGCFPHARNTGQWLIPQCCLDGHPAGDESSISETDANVARIEQENRLMKAENEQKQHKIDRFKKDREIGIAELGYQVVETFERDRQGVTADMEANERKAAALDQRGAVLRRTEEWLTTLKGEVKANQETVLDNIRSQLDYEDVLPQEIKVRFPYPTIYKVKFSVKPRLEDGAFADEPGDEEAEE